MVERQQLCTFYVDQLLFGVPVTQVQEVMMAHAMTVVPRANNVIGGLLNLRGNIVTAIDLRQRLGLPARETEHAPMNVVMRVGEDTVSFLVDDIGDVIDVDVEAFEENPPNITGVGRDLIDGVYKLDEQLLLLLNAPKTMAFDHQV